VPPIWDVEDVIYQLETIEEGVTTKSEVLEKFGEPYYRDEDINLFTYNGETSKGYVFAAAGYTGSGTLIDEQSWWVTIYFDESDAVAFLVTSEMTDSQKSDARIETQLKERAKKGNAEAQFQMYKLSASNSERWRWLCLAANQGHPFAQEEVGELNMQSRKEFWRIERPDEPDKIAAYVWYSLAFSNGSKRAEFFRDHVAEDMTGEEIATANRLVAEWRPNSTECEETGAR